MLLELFVISTYYKLSIHLTGVSVKGHLYSLSPVYNIHSHVGKGLLERDSLQDIMLLPHDKRPKLVCLLELNYSSVFKAVSFMSECCPAHMQAERKTASSA